MAMHCTARPASVMNPDVSLYGIIADLRREHPTPAGMQTLDLVVAELGRTRDNLKEALPPSTSKPLPPGGKPVLDELVARARQAGVYDLDYGPDPLRQAARGAAGRGNGGHRRSAGASPRWSASRWPSSRCGSASTRSFTLSSG